MIDVIARLNKGVYLAGETVECGITFKNPSPPPDAKSQWNDQEEVLGWGSAQIHCQCVVSHSRVSVPTISIAAEDQAVSNSRTSFAPCRVDNVAQPGQATPLQALNSPRVVLSTKPVILFCDLRLLPGQTKTFWYRETLPLEGPPSFRGQTVKYAYKLTIGTQRLISPIKHLSVPIRVLVLQEFTESSLGQVNEDLSPSNPFLNSERRKESFDFPLESALQVLQVVTSQRNHKFYNVTNTRGHVVKFCIFKQAYKLGEDIVGSLDFTESNVPCVQYAVTLQSSEEVTPECRRNEDQRPLLASYSKFHEMCMGLQQTSFVLPVPLHVTPSFGTEIVHLKWRLHFEFVTSTGEGGEVAMKSPEGPKPEDLDGQIWQGPSSINIETMVWDLPIKLYPNLPSYLSQGLQMQTEFDLSI